MNKIRNKMEKIEKETPLSCENAEDGRYIWPKRWEKLKMSAIEPAVTNLKIKFDNIQSFEEFDSAMAESTYRWSLYYLIKEVLKNE